MYDRRHRRNINRLIKLVAQAIDRAGDKAARKAAGRNLQSREVQKELDEITRKLADRITALIEQGYNSEWQLSEEKNAELIDNVAKRTGMTKAQAARLKLPSLEALRAFQDRRDYGLNLSDRVWQIGSQYRAELELALALGIQEGKSAAALSRDVRELLKEPHKLFRRVRDKNTGRLKLSRAAREYHPGRGVYRSSYKNAIRLTATETNIAYRTADHNRWQQLPFVVGQEIGLSNNHPVKDICDELKGQYPKDFKFTGWHPFCRCNVKSILKTDEEIRADNERIMNGLPPAPEKESTRTPPAPPAAFTRYIRLHPDKVNAKKPAYWVRDNQKYIQEKQKAETQLGTVLNKIKKENIAYNEVSYLQSSLTDSEIIERLSGGDLTKGSCSSLAFAFAGNKAGLDVLDFRGGNSLDFFCKENNIMEIVEKLGGTVASHTNDYKKAKELLSHVQEGKMYYFTCGKHAAIVRKVETEIQYLELQDPVKSGNRFHPLDDKKLKKRFGAQKSHTFYRKKYSTRDCIIDIEQLGSDEGFAKLLGYINTEKGKQMKGAKGGKK